MVWPLQAPAVSCLDSCMDGPNFNAAASLSIGHGINMKRLQKGRGQSCIRTTANSCGHLFCNADHDQEEVAAAKTPCWG